MSYEPERGVCNPATQKRSDNPAITAPLLQLIYQFKRSLLTSLRIGRFEVADRVQHVWADPTEHVRKFEVIVLSASGAEHHPLIASPNVSE